MAEKRMISKRVFLSNGFHRMSNGAKALYVMLALHSDDDGFSNSATICEAFLGVGDEALWELVRGGFVMWFEDEGVALITHWKQQNCLKNERVGKLSYPGIARRIFVHQNGTYSLERGEDGVSFGSYKECLYRYGRDAAEGMLKCATDGSIVERSTGAAVGSVQAAGTAHGDHAVQTVGGIGSIGGIEGAEAVRGAECRGGASASEAPRSTVGTVGTMGTVGTVGTSDNAGNVGGIGGNFEIKRDGAGVFSLPHGESLPVFCENNRDRVPEDEIINYVSSEMRETEAAIFGAEADVFSGENSTCGNFSSPVGESSESDVTIHNFLGNPGEKNGKEERRTESFYAAEAAVARGREAAASSATADSERDTVLSFFRKTGGSFGDEARGAGWKYPDGGGVFASYGVSRGAPLGGGVPFDGDPAEYGGELSPFSENGEASDSDAPVLFSDGTGGLSDRSVICGDEVGELPDRWKKTADGGGELPERRWGSVPGAESVGELREKREKLRETEEKLCEDDEILCESGGSLCSFEKGALRGKKRHHLDGFEVLEDNNSGEYEVCRDGRFLRRCDGRIFRRMPAVDGSSGDLLLPIDRLIDLPGARNDSERLEAFLAKEEGYSDADFRVSPIGGLGRGVVMLSEVQIGRLLRDLSLEEFDHYVSRLAEFIEKNHPTVKNHYKTILRWVREDRAIDA